MLLYYITDRSQFPGNEAERRARLLQKISEAARAGIDYIQLREKDLVARELESLAREAVKIVRNAGSGTRLLVNSRTDIALAVGADGVHLQSTDVSPADVKNIWREANGPAQPIIAVSCHDEDAIVTAQNATANFVVFGPIFEKKGGSGTTGSLDDLRNVSRHKIPILALGGITLENAASCIAAGASGIAAIRLFQENEIARVVETLSTETRKLS
ncbi:MAG TPA: thiamine phosphate synthase [Terriglobales bacterium]|nr:thiamine phosphate synthase [Terriglobales bacterium]